MIPEGIARRSFGGGRRNSLNSPVVVIRPILFILFIPISVNHNARSGPTVIPEKTSWPSFAVGRRNSLIAPAVVIRPILFLVLSVNYNAPSGPAVIPKGRPFVVRRRFVLIGDNRDFTSSDNARRALSNSSVATRRLVSGRAT